MGARCCWAQRNRPLSGGNAAGLAHSWSTLTHTMYKMWVPKSFGSSAWAAGGPGWDGVGVRLAQRRGEQASNTNQGDLVMDIGLTERALCSVVGLNQLLHSHTSHVCSALLGASSSIFLSCKKSKTKQGMLISSRMLIYFASPHLSHLSYTHAHNLSADMSLQSPLTEKHQLSVWTYRLVLS